MITLNWILFIIVAILTLVYWYYSKLLIDITKLTESDEISRLIIRNIAFPIKVYDISESISAEKIWETRSLRIDLFGEAKMRQRRIRICVNIPIRDLVSEEKIIQEAEELKDHFMRNTNEKAIKPLDTIINTSGQLMMIADSLTVPDMARKIIDKTKATINLFENIIILANLQVNRNPTNREEIDCVKLLEEVRIKYLEDIKETGKDIDLVLDQPYAKSIIFPERSRLMLVLNNYLSNAIEYTMSGTIHFGIIHTEDNQVLLYVKDTGTGISGVDRENLFDKSTLSEGSKHVGQGLGLNICKQIALNSGGDYGVVSEEGQGTTFWMSLPLKFEYSEKKDYDWTGIKEIVKKIQG